MVTSMRYLNNGLLIEIEDATRTNGGTETTKGN